MSPNGERGIRTLDTGLTPYNGLANRRLQPLGHLSNVRVPQSRRCGVVAQLTARREQGSRAINGHRALFECAPLRSTRKLVIARVLDGEDRGKVPVAPMVEDSIEHSRSIRRVDKRDVVRVRPERRRESQCVPLEYARAVTQPQRGNICPQRMQARRPDFYEVGTDRAAGDRLESKGAGAREEVQHAGVLHVRRE